MARDATGSTSAASTLQFSVHSLLFQTGVIHDVHAGLPSNFSHRDYKPPTEIPCIVHLLCQRHEGLEMEAKEIKEFWWKPYVRKLFDKKVSHVSEYYDKYRLQTDATKTYSISRLVIFFFLF